MTCSTDNLSRRMAVLTIALVTLASSGVTSPRTLAQEDSATDAALEEMSPEEFDKMLTDELGLHWATSPATAPIGEQAEISIGGGLRFAESNDAQRLLEAFGNLPDDTVIGLLTPDNSTDWFVVFSFEDIGYVKDDEKNDIDKDALLEHFRESSARGNQQRRQMGLAEMNLVGWAVEPYYNDQSKSLEWGVTFESEGAEIVNYYTKRLGRHGVMNCNLVVDPEDLNEVLPQVRAALEGFSYNDGGKYAQFRVGDKVAEYGLTALVAGGALAVAAKSGLLGKLWKLIVVAVLAVGAGIKRMFTSIRGTPAEA